MWNKHPYRPVLWALLLSLLAHLLLLGQLPSLEWSLSAEAPLVMELAPAPQPAALPLPKRKSATVKKAIHRDASRRPAKSLPPAEPVVTPAPPVVDSPPQPQPQPAAEPEPPAAAPAAAEEAGLADAQPEAQPPAPTHVEIEYRILHKGGAVGVEHQSYLASADGRYSLTSVAEPKGLLALALSDLVQKSEGFVTGEGLRPTTYLYQYGKNPDKAQKATFDWASQTLTMESGGRSWMVALANGAQDLMSFMYQFMFIPPLQEMHLAITNGKRFKTYDYSFEGEETLQTAMGPLRCMHLTKSSGDGEEKTEVWLAADYHYLPVKISKTEKDGTVTERIATHLQIE